MAFEYIVGSTTIPLSTGNFSVTGLPFQPKLVKFWSEGQFADGTDPNWALGFGAAVSSTSRFAITALDLDAQATTDSWRRHDNTKCFIKTDATGAVDWAVDFVSFNADGFTLNLTTADGVARVLNYEAFGGDTLEEVAILQFQTRASAGSEAETGVGFQPDFIEFFSAGMTTAPASGSATAITSIGAASGATAEGVTHIRASDAQAAGWAYHGHATNAVLMTVSLAGPGTVILEADLTSFDADGFTLNYTASSAAFYAWAICYKGGNYKVGEITQKTSTGNQAYTGVGFRPAGISLCSANDASNSDTETGISFSYGAGSSSTQRGSIWVGSNNGADPTEADQYLDRANILRMNTAGTPTTEAVADLVSLDADGFTLDWTTADATARTIRYIAYGPGVAGGGGGGGGARHLALLGVGT